jgi:hypothetical protein
VPTEIRPDSRGPEKRRIRGRRRAEACPTDPTGDLPLWLTEYGAPTSAAASGWGGKLTEDEQAQRLRVAFALAVRLPFVQNVTWFEYRDACADPAVADCHFGLVRHDLSHRPAYAALREVVGGVTARLRPRLVLGTRVTRGRRRSGRRGGGRGRRADRVTVKGRLLLPGSQHSAGRISLRLSRRGARATKLDVPVRSGAFRARLRRHGRRRWTIEARYAGSRAYEPAVARVHLRSG